MTTSTMNISLPETLKRFVKERSKTANYSNPSDYVRALIRDDQRRLAAERLLEGMIEKHMGSDPSASPAKLEKLRTEYWLRWTELKNDIDKGLMSLEQGKSRRLDHSLAEDIKARGRKRLGAAKTA
jgi:Arc/MetJ-type ribon-helix-helix transcriptional regulator